MLYTSLTSDICAWELRRDVLNVEEEREFWRLKCLIRTHFDREGGRVRDPQNRLPDVHQ